MHAQRRSSARWYDSECRSIKREIRRLERLYRRHRSPEARSAWQNQFVFQRRTFQRKFSEFWLNTVESQRTNPRGIWHVVNHILKPPLKVQTKRRTSVSTTSRLTFTTRLPASVAQQQTHLRRPSRLDLLLHSLCLTRLQSRRSLFSSRRLQPSHVPGPNTNLASQTSSYLYNPVISRLHNLSLLSGLFPSALKHALVYSLPLESKSYHWIPMCSITTVPFQTFHTYPN